MALLEKLFGKPNASEDASTLRFFLVKRLGAIQAQKAYKANDLVVVIDEVAIHLDLLQCILIVEALNDSRIKVEGLYQALEEVLSLEMSKGARQAYMEKAKSNISKMRLILDKLEGNFNERFLILVFQFAGTMYSVDESEIESNWPAINRNFVHEWQDKQLFFRLLINAKTEVESIKYFLDISEEERLVLASNAWRRLSEIASGSVVDTKRYPIVEPDALIPTLLLPIRVSLSLLSRSWGSQYEAYQWMVRYVVEKANAFSGKQNSTNIDFAFDYQERWDEQAREASLELGDTTYLMLGVAEVFGIGVQDMADEEFQENILKPFSEFLVSQFLEVHRFSKTRE